MPSSTILISCARNFLLSTPEQEYGWKAIHQISKAAQVAILLHIFGAKPLKEKVIIKIKSKIIMIEEICLKDSMSNR